MVSTPIEKWRANIRLNIETISTTSEKWRATVPISVGLVRIIHLHPLFNQGFSEKEQQRCFFL